MIAEVMPSEIQKVLFSINGYKSPGPDGFIALFFQRLGPLFSRIL